MRRRECITLLDAAVASPLLARARRDDSMRHVAVLLAGQEDDPDLQGRGSQVCEKRSSTVLSSVTSTGDGQRPS
jgi:hypothetical protein